MADRGVQPPGDGGNGFDWFAGTWLSKDEIELKLRLETSVYRATFSRARLVDKDWNMAVFERGFWFWKVRTVIFICMNGRVCWEDSKI